MFALNAGTWPATTENPAEARDRYHRVALHEARINADRHPASDHLAGTSLVERIRAAVGLASTRPDSLACCA